MTRLGTHERVLLAIWLPLWVFCFAMSLRTLAADIHISNAMTTSPAGADEPPVVLGFRPYLDETELRVGDRLLRLGEADLRGTSAVGFQTRVMMESERDPRLSLRYERAGEVAETLLPVAPWSIVILPMLPVSLAAAVVGLIGLLRAPPTPLIRAGFSALLCGAVYFASHFAWGPAVTRLGVWFSGLGACLVWPLAVRALQRFPMDETPRSAWGRAWPWLLAPPGILITSVLYGAPLALAPEVGYPVMFVWASVLMGIFLAVSTRNYLRADPVGRRQMKWVVFGLWAALLPTAVLTSVGAVDQSLARWGLNSVSLGVLIPLSLLVAIARYNLFDIDRLLSATASYNLVVVALVAAGFVVVPRVAEAASGMVGLDPGAGQVALSLALAAAVVPLHRRLRPRIDSLFFKERHAVDRGVAEMLAALGSCADARELTRRVGEGLGRLFGPESCAVYAGDADGYTPVFAEGPAVPPAFEATSLLLEALRRRRQPLALARAGSRADEAPLGPFDRAALETLGAEVVVPIWYGDALAAFACLGRRRSGDVYTPTDLSLLALVAQSVSAHMLRFDQEKLLAQEREMQASLRRYVPGAIADSLSSGDALEAGEREVTVLFVDIRGYTSYAESRRVEEIFSTVNRYTEIVSEVVRVCGGSVVEFNGDGMMAVFGAPRALEAKERAAVEAGREIVTLVGELEVEGPEGAPQRLSVGVGIATGPAFVGNIRAVDRMIWSAIGNTTNLAARLQSLSRDLDAALVIDAATRGRLGGAGMGFEARPGLRIRGRSAAQDVHVLPLEG